MIVRQKMKHLIAIVAFILPVFCFAEEVGRETEIENSTPHQLEELKGKIVVFEGIAWGDGWPGLGRRVVLGTGARIYFSSKSIAPDFPNGRLVRVHGRLKNLHRMAAKGIEAGYDRSFDYWVIEDSTIVVIEKIETDAIEEYAPAKQKEANQSSQPMPLARHG